jgi:hypothetical protein
MRILNLLLLLAGISSCTLESKSKNASAQKSFAAVAAKNIQLIDAENFRKHWNQFVSLKLTRCERVMYGGFKRIEFTLYNDSPYMIDTICVKVNYIEDNKKIYKTGFATAIDVEQGETIILDAPYSSRGDSLNYEVDYLKVTEAKLDYKEKITGSRRGAKEQSQNDRLLSKQYFPMKQFSYF